MRAQVTLIFTIVMALLASASAKPNIDLRQLHGRVQVVNQNADYKIRLVHGTTIDPCDLRVKDYGVNDPPEKAGCWRFVDRNADFTVEYVEKAGREDIRVHLTSHHPGVTTRGRERYSASRPRRVVLTREQYVAKYKDEPVDFNSRVPNGLVYYVGGEGFFYDPARDSRSGAKPGEIIRVDVPHEPPANAPYKAQTKNGIKIGDLVAVKYKYQLYAVPVKLVDLRDKIWYRLPNGARGTKHSYDCFPLVSKEWATGATVWALKADSIMEKGTIQSKTDKGYMVAWEEGAPTDVEQRFICERKVSSGRRGRGRGR